MNRGITRQPGPDGAGDPGRQDATTNSEPNPDAAQDQALIAKLTARITELEAEVQQLRSGAGGLRRILDPAPNGAWDVIGERGAQTPIYRTSQAVALWQALDATVKQTTGYLRGAEQTHFYAVAALSLSLVPDLPDRLGVKLEGWQGRITDRNKHVIYGALWRAMVEGIQGIQIG